MGRGIIIFRGIEMSQTMTTADFLEWAQKRIAYLEEQVTRNESKAKNFDTLLEVLGIVTPHVKAGRKEPLVDALLDKVVECRKLKALLLDIRAIRQADEVVGKMIEEGLCQSK